jgi:type IX secretion system PorP/SprF family membrane protein
MQLQFKRFFFLSVFFCCLKNYSQETLPIYQDYLSDNVYLVHPSAAGIGNSSKLRMTARQQWAGIPDAPTLQTLSFHTKFGEESNAGYGFILFNDKNGYHSQKGLQGTYTYHLPLSDARFFEQLSFGLAFTFVQNQSDQRSFGGS